MRLIALIVGAE